MPEVGQERTETCQECGREYDPRKEGYYVDTVDVGADASGGTATVFRQDAEKFGDWLGFEEEDIGPWCEDCSWKIQRRRTRNSATSTQPERADEPLTDGGQDVLIHAAPIDLGHKWLGNLGADELAYWRVSGTPQRTEPGCRVWFESGGRITAWGEIEDVEDGKLWFDGAHKTDLPCPDDVPTQGFTYIDPLLPRLDEVPGSARSHDTDRGEIRTDGGEVEKFYEEREQEYRDLNARSHVVDSKFIVDCPGCGSSMVLGQYWKGCAIPECPGCNDTADEWTDDPRVPESKAEKLSEGPADIPELVRT